MKLSPAGREHVLKVIQDVKNGDSAMVPSSNEIDKWYLCDMIQHLVDEGNVKVVPVPVYGGWREVDTPVDLQRANNSMHYLNDQKGQAALVRSMGATFLSEANDLKRPTEIVAKELNLDHDLLTSFIDGEVEMETAYNIMRCMSDNYPVAFSDLWIEKDDTQEGVRVFTADESKATARVLSRADRDGNRTPYYEYRDSAMSRIGPFRPEWIKELRVVDDNDAYNPDIAYNNGHLMFQTTFFIGPVNFYYELRGKKYCFEANTGDSNFISPFVKHSFASRDPDNLGLIIAVTYGGAVRSALTDFGRVGASNLDAIAGDLRDIAPARKQSLQRALMAESMSSEQLCKGAAAGGAGSVERMRAIVNDGASPTNEELKGIAEVLSVTPDLLRVHELLPEEEVVITTRASEADCEAYGLNPGHKEHLQRHEERPYPSEEDPSYRFTPLSRTKHHPNLKTFIMDVQANTDEVQAGITAGLHQFVYNYSEDNVTLRWGADMANSRVLEPGASGYIAPMVEHAYETDSSDGTPSPVYVVRIPGCWTKETLDEFSSFETGGRSRVGGENMRWYN